MTNTQDEAERIAETIFDDVWLKRCGDKASTLNAIATALRSYGSKQREEGRQELFSQTYWDVRLKEAYAEGRQQGAFECRHAKDIAYAEGRKAGIGLALELFAVFFNDHSTRCAFVNRPAGVCTCQIPFRVAKLRSLIEGEK